MNYFATNRPATKLLRALFLATISAAFATSPSFAVPNDRGKLVVGVDFIVASPKNEFSDNVTNNGYGVIFDFGYLFPRSPLTIGLAGGFLIYGHETRREPFSLTIPDVTVEVTRSNNIVPIHLFMRLSPGAGSVLPYAEGRVGLSYLFTETSIKDVDESDEDIASSKNIEDVAFSYGGGGGLMIRLYQRTDDGRRSGRRGGDTKVSSVYLNLGLFYLKGGEAEYLTKGSIEIENGNVIYNVSQSRTDLLMFQIGVSLAF